MLGQAIFGQPNLAAISGRSGGLQVIQPARLDDADTIFPIIIFPPKTIFPGKFDDPDTIFTVSILRAGGNIFPDRYFNSSLIFTHSIVAFPKAPEYDYKLPDPSAQGDYGRRKQVINQGRRIIGRLGK